MTPINRMAKYFEPDPAPAPAAAPTPENAMVQKFDRFTVQIHGVNAVLFDKQLQIKCGVLDLRCFLSGIGKCVKVGVLIPDGFTDTDCDLREWTASHFHQLAEKLTAAAIALEATEGGAQ